MNDEHAKTEVCHCRCCRKRRREALAKAIAAAPPPVPTPVKEYVLERQYHVKRVGGRFR